ncbi:sulfite exporter TauE/SafE family protein [Fibrella aquatilis]|uniref:Probable membrane transporter protein n=1 Tax=Fibrella aquatilis TaxID=2817059 RepID=A0A939G4A5_9BACT|nr:sulfite exporter TauE/SafE family protein [Fibrella aquatilis]MBO0931621.1 sulfite exporter TauE/SafE family protein [Fibrella aquatilis]
MSSLLLPVLFLVGLVYASVGHGGASGYIVAMTLLGVAPEQIKPTALLLNLFVSSVAFFQYYRAGHFRWATFWPFAISSVPLAFVGARIPLSDTLYKQLLAAALLLLIVRLVWSAKATEETQKPIPLGVGLLVGGAVGLLSGMLGIGGGIILSPLLLMFNWATIRQTAATSALFIFVNSLSGLVGLVTKGYSPAPEQYAWIAAAFAGGLVGGYLGSHRFSIPVLRYVLALGVAVACVKLLI